MDKKVLFAASKKQVGMENENPINRAYMEDFFAWIYGQYTKEFDLHMTGLIMDVADIKPFELSDYKRFDDKTLLVLPKADKAFSEDAQTDLLLSMPKAKTVKVEGGHIPPHSIRLMNMCGKQESFLRLICDVNRIIHMHKPPKGGRLWYLRKVTLSVIFVIVRKELLFPYQSIKGSLSTGILIH